MAMLDFILGAVLPSFLQNEGRQRQQLASPTLAQAQPQEQQPQKPQQQPQFAPYPTSDLQSEPASAMDQQPKNMMPAPRGEINQPTYEGRPVVQNPDGSWSHERSISIEADGKHMNIPTMFGGQSVSPDQAVEIMRQNNWIDPDTGRPVGTFGSQAEALQAAQTKEKQQQGMGGTPPSGGSTQGAGGSTPNSGGGLVDQITKLTTSPLGLGGMGALAGVMGSPRNRGFGGAVSQGLMGSMYGLQAGSQLQNQREQTQSTAQYHQQQAEAQRQQVELAKQKIQQEQALTDSYNAAMGRLRQTDPALADRVAVGIKTQPDVFETFLRAHGGDVHATINDPDFQKLLSLQHPGSGSAGTSFGSYRAEMEGKNVPFGTEKFNLEWNRRQIAQKEEAPAEKRAAAEVPKRDQEREIDNRNKFLSRVQAYQGSYEYKEALTDPPRAKKLLAAKKKEIWKALGLKGEPPAEQAKADRPSLDEIFSGGPSE